MNQTFSAPPGFGQISAVPRRHHFLAVTPWIEILFLLSLIAALPSGGC